MRHDAPFVVKVYGPMIGYGCTGRRRISVAVQCYSLDEALQAAGTDLRQARRDHEPRFYWIERRHHKAHRPLRNP
jgi:hypothetical protein